MNGCSFEVLVRYLDKKLGLDEKLDLFWHLEKCETCRDAIYQISRDRDAIFFVRRPYKVERILAS